MSDVVGYSIVMDAEAVETVLAQTASLFPRYINSWLVEAATLAKEEMRSRVNEGVGAAYGAGIKHNIDVDYDTDAMTALVKPNSNVPYADALETGTGPHKVPTNPDGPLAAWCELKGLNLYAVAKTIERKGTQPHPFVAPTYAAVLDPISQLFSDGVGVFLDQMGVAS